MATFDSTTKPYFNYTDGAECGTTCAGLPLATTPNVLGPICLTLIGASPMAASGGR